MKHDELVANIQHATREVFSTMLGLELEAANAYQEQAAVVSSNGVVSFIGLAGKWVGTGSISCTPTFACQIASTLMMTEYAAVDEEVLDAVAEVTNMILGNVKTSLEEHLGPMGLSIPTVIYGRNFSSRTVGKQNWSVVPFFYSGEKIEVQLCLAPNRETSRTRPVVSASMVTA